MLAGCGHVWKENGGMISISNFEQHFKFITKCEAILSPITPFPMFRRWKEKKIEIKMEALPEGEE